MPNSFIWLNFALAFANFEFALYMLNFYFVEFFGFDWFSTLWRKVIFIERTRYLRTLSDSVSKTASKNKIEFTIIISYNIFELVIICKISLRLNPKLLLLLFKIKAQSLRNFDVEERSKSSLNIYINLLKVWIIKKKKKKIQENKETIWLMPD